MQCNKKCNTDSGGTPPAPPRPGSGSITSNRILKSERFHELVNEQLYRQKRTPISDNSAEPRITSSAKDFKLLLYTICVHGNSEVRLETAF